MVLCFNKNPMKIVHKLYEDAWSRLDIIEEKMLADAQKKKRFSAFCIPSNS